jgi:hypothetical protein
MVRQGSFAAQTILASVGSLCLFVATSAFAYVGTDPLPKGVRAGAFVYGFGKGIDSTLNSEGRLESLVQPLNRSVSVQDIAAEEPKLQQLIKILDSFEAGLGDKLLQADLFSDIDIREERFVTGFLWGVTDRFSLGAIVPIVKRRIDVDFHASVVNNAEAIAKRFGHIPQVAEGLEEVRKAQIDTARFSDAIFAGSGYETPGTIENSGLGDLELESRYTYYSDRWLGLALRGRVQVPTSTHRPDLRQLVDRELAEGNWALKAATIHEVKFVPGLLSWSSSLWGTWRAPTTRTMAFARSTDQNLPDLNDPYQIETLQRQYGPQLDLDTGLQLSLFNGVFNFMGSYQYTLRGSDKLFGKRDLDYARWTANTESETHGVEFIAEFSTIPLYFSKTWPLPSKVSFTWYQPFKGRNSIYTPYGRIDVVVLF